MIVFRIPCTLCRNTSLNVYDLQQNIKIKETMYSYPELRKLFCTVTKICFKKSRVTVIQKVIFRLFILLSLQNKIDIIIFWSLRPKKKVDFYMLYNFILKMENVKHIEKRKAIRCKQQSNQSITVYRKYKNNFYVFYCDWLLPYCLVSTAPYDICTNNSLLWTVYNGSNIA